MNDKTPQLCKAVHRPSSVWCDREVGHKGQHRGDAYSNEPRETIRWRHHRLEIEMTTAHNEIQEAALSGALGGKDAAAASITRHTVGCMCPQCDAARDEFTSGRLSAAEEIRSHAAIAGNACCGGNGFEASCKVCSRD